MSTKTQGFKRQPKLSFETHQKIIALDEHAKRPAAIAKELGISEWAVRRHLDARYSYEPKLELKREASAKPIEGSGEWVTQLGFYWIYFNTHKGRNGNCPWVLRHFDNRDHWQANYPKLGTFEDIFVTEFHAGRYPLLGVSDMKSVYVEKAPWKTSKSSITYVRGFLKVEGVVEYRR